MTMAIGPAPDGVIASPRVVPTSTTQPVRYALMLTCCPPEATTVVRPAHVRLVIFPLPLLVVESTKTFLRLL